ncbi:hypothetical protein [Allorhizobium borbori]|uniref:Uncharacterized protein n=1 Tax=Allorhizobium borbori TaxID=485907 RepID=A0A7W6JZJ5_9HYPH|nr:hypothetical protein [Allorhizobium borbori]MBB4102415.1 hypothetical protein [Allorhizobium borbori]
MSGSFADFLKSKGKAVVPPSRPTSKPYVSRIVYLVRRPDGSVEERNGAPPFMFQDGRFVVERIVLPKDHYWRGSPEHLRRLDEMKAAKGA